MLLYLREITSSSLFVSRRERERELKEKGRNFFFFFSVSDCYIVNEGIVIISSVPHICFSLEYSH
jgi:hypothetical protein